VRCLRNHLVPWLARCVLLATVSGFGQAAPDPWLIPAGGQKGLLNAHTSREDLVRVFGAANVVDQDVDVGEGETQPGTVLFPGDSKRAIEILWKDPSKKTAPAFLTVRGLASRWKTAHNISLGTSLKELERINGRPFHLTGFRWDDPGTITSWENGVLATELVAGRGRILLRLDSPPRSDVTEKEDLEVAGDRDFSSHHPVMQKINPRVYEMTWELP